ncbi:cytochrome P450 family protein [Streptomyces rhizosphaerihabitans]|uniref:cytochrome P450 family protein n=1 Tax=Streptomyces rhizosphaerihabitans TaxID=1266770 RepID=UPI0021C1732E|nr:cytochrome P450 [Streptomyces rhizosphaerihabitans]MCT9008781.1 cytochrome P450 [Streptomyces rhizosphaerihabitans]
MAEQIISLTNPEFTTDPVCAYARLREEAPLVRVGFPGGPRVWLVTRNEDVKAVLSDPRLVVDYSNVPGHQGPSVADQMVAALDLPDEFRPYVAANMMLKDGPDHARQRRLVTPAFTVRRIKALRPRVEEISAQLLDTLARKGSGDLIEDYSSPLTGTVICELIGIDETDQPQVRKWMNEYTDVGADLAESAGNMVAYIKKLIARRRAEPANDMISALVQTCDEDGDRLSEDEIISMALLVVNNGHHSTSHFIPNAVLALFDNPDQLALLRARPDALPHAIEELMRVANPIPTAGPRYATEDMEFAGVPIRKGDALTGSYLSANYDPRVFPDPERCEVERVLKRGQGHLAYGAGPHYCPGAALAHLEGEIALSHLLLQRDSLEITVSRDALRYTEATPGGARLLNALPVRL